MVKVYDMVTYGLCASEQGAHELNFGTPCAARLEVPALGLQQIEAAPAPHRDAIHPALKHMDVDSFLAALDD